MLKDQICGHPVVGLPAELQLASQYVFTTDVPAIAGCRKLRTNIVCGWRSGVAGDFAAPKTYQVTAHRLGVTPEAVGIVADHGQARCKGVTQRHVQGKFEFFDVAIVAGVLPIVHLEHT